MTRTKSVVIAFAVMLVLHCGAVARAFTTRPSRLEFMDVQQQCTGTRTWITHEMAHGDMEAAMLNKDREPTDTGLELEDKLRFKRSLASGNATERSFTLLCITYTYKKANAKGATMHRTWGANCTRHVVVTNEGPIDGVPHDDVLVMTPVGGEADDNLWAKTRAIFTTLALRRPELGHFDFYFMGGDDVMMYKPNLFALLQEPSVSSSHQQGAPLFFGHRFVSPSGDEVRIEDTSETLNLEAWGQQTEFASGAGYVFNRPALHLAARLIDQNHSASQPNARDHAEDVYIAECFEKGLGVYTRDARDAQGEVRFSPFPPSYLNSIAADPNATSWYGEFNPGQEPRGADVVSRHAVVFHYITPEDAVRLTAKHSSVQAII